MTYEGVEFNEMPDTFLSFPELWLSPNSMHGFYT